MTSETSTLIASLLQSFLRIRLSIHFPRQTRGKGEQTLSQMSLSPSQHFLARSSSTGEGKRERHDAISSLRSIGLSFESRLREAVSESLDDGEEERRERSEEIV